MSAFDVQLVECVDMELKDMEGNFPPQQGRGQGYKSCVLAPATHPTPTSELRRGLVGALGLCAARPLLRSASFLPAHRCS